MPQAVLDLILKRAVKSKLPPADMIKTLFIFSDIEFDACVTTSDKPPPPDSYYRSYSVGSSATNRTTNFEAAKRSFAAVGYELPNVVFWNLRGSFRSHGHGIASSPVTSHDSGAALVSGFSGQLLRLFMGDELFEKRDAITPMYIMEQAIGRYGKWAVVD